MSVLRLAPTSTGWTAKWTGARRRPVGLVRTMDLTACRAHTGEMDEQQPRHGALRQGRAPRRVLTGAAVGALLGLTALAGGAAADAAPRQAAAVTSAIATPAAHSTQLRLTSPAAPAAVAPSTRTRMGSCSVAMMDM